MQARCESATANGRKEPTASRTTKVIDTHTTLCRMHSDIAVDHCSDVVAATLEQVIVGTSCTFRLV